MGRLPAAGVSRREASPRALCRSGHAAKRGSLLTWRSVRQAGWPRVAARRGRVREAAARGWTTIGCARNTPCMGTKVVVPPGARGAPLCRANSAHAVPTGMKVCVECAFEARLRMAKWPPFGEEPAGGPEWREEARVTMRRLTARLTLAQL